MKQILLQIISDSSKMTTIKSKSSLTENYWFWIAAAELGLILFLIAKLRQKQKVMLDSTTKELLNKSKNSNVDMDNLMNSINKSRELYKLLSTKCHPDRFLEENINKKASEIFQEISKNQRNYNRLLELKEIAQTELNITI
jgi:hypothetical protein